jgi:hypothetical protein
LSDFQPKFVVEWYSKRIDRWAPYAYYSTEAGALNAVARLKEVYDDARYLPYEPVAHETAKNPTAPARVAYYFVRREGQIYGGMPPLLKEYYLGDSLRNVSDYISELKRNDWTFDDFDFRRGFEEKRFSQDNTLLSSRRLTNEELSDLWTKSGPVAHEKYGPLRSEKRAPVKETPTRPMEAFIPEAAQQAYQATWGEFEKIAEQMPPGLQTCSCTDIDPLKARYKKLIVLAEDPTLSHEQRQAIVEESLEVLDEIMRGSKYYPQFKKQLEEKRRGEGLAPGREPKFTFRKGMPSGEAGQYEKFEEEPF